MSSPSWISGQSNSPQVDFANEEVNYDYVEQESSVKTFRKSSIVGGAAIAGTTAGLIMAGPVIAIISGVAAAIVATQDSRSGRVARWSGETVLTASETVKDLNQKTQIVQKTKWGFGAVVRKAGEIDERHQIVEKSKRGLDNTLQAAKEVDEKHGISENINHGFQKHFGFIAKKFKRKPNCNYTPWEQRGNQIEERRYY